MRVNQPVRRQTSPAPPPRPGILPHLFRDVQSERQVIVEPFAADLVLLVLQLLPVLPSDVRLFAHLAHGALNPVEKWKRKLDGAKRFCFKCVTVDSKDALKDDSLVVLVIDRGNSSRFVIKPVIKTPITLLGLM